MRTAATVETAVSFAQLLNQTRDERELIDEYFHDEPVDPNAVAAWHRTERILQIANGTWVRSLIDSDLAGVIEQQLTKSALRVHRNPYAGSVAIVTPGVLERLADRIETDRHAREADSDGQYSAVTPATFDAMIAEGIIDWVIRTGADADYEVRACALCGKWFEPQLKARSRFCSPKCRKNFNNLRGSDAHAARFTCGSCATERSMDEFAGLRFVESAKDTASPLRITRYLFDDETLCCVACVRCNFPEWRRYLAPMESLNERVVG
jgi:hypothetical protein